MFRISWKDRYNINYKEIDDQHKGLLAILNELADLRGQGADADRVADIFHRLCQYALTHFATEERYMEAAGYPGLARHQAEHASFIGDLLEFNRTHEPGDPRLAEATFTFVKDWYLTHIMRSDQDYASSLKGYFGRAKIQGIIFDLSEVVCSLDEGRFLEAAAPLCGRAIEDLRALVDAQSGLFRDYESGRIDSKAFLDQFSRLCGETIPGAELAQAYAQVFTPLEATLELVRRLKPLYRLGLIADTTPLRYERGLEGLDIPSLFDAVTMPCAVGAVKPAQAVFQDMTSKLGLMAEECVYVDDQPTLALAATEQCLHGLAFSGAEPLRADLRKLKVVI